MKRILVTGSSGMLGSAVLQKLISKGFDGIGLSRTRNERLPVSVQIQGDLTDLSFLEKQLANINPDVILHCAANVHVDACEKDRKGTHLLHVETSRVLAQYASQREIAPAKVIYISTDAVYDGMAGNYKETDRTNPRNYYAQTKLEGEQEVQKNAKTWAILRTNLYGFHPQPPLNGKLSISEWGLKEMRAGRTIKGFTDVFFNPLYAHQLASAVSAIVESSFQGIMNLASLDQSSKFDFLVAIAKSFGLDPQLVKPDSVDSMGFAERPKNTTMNTDLMKKVLGQVPSLKNGIENFKNDVLSSGVFS